ncbi:MAG: HD domain-containing protein [Firmicutes bacterium]|nr:HD domain-containing protein [Bacillota bacterium]
MKAPRTIIYELIIMALAAAILIAFLLEFQNLIIHHGTGNFMTRWYMAGALIIACFCQIFTLNIPGQGILRASFPVFYAISFIYGPSVTVLVVLISFLFSIVIEYRNKRDIVSELFDAAVWIITFAVTGLTFLLMYKEGGFFGAGEWEITALNLFAIFISALFGIVVNDEVMTLKKVFKERTSIYNIFYINNSRAKIYVLILAPTGILIAFLATREPLGLLFLAMPMIIMYRSLRSFTELLSEAKATLEILADTVDKRADFNKDHSRRVETYAKNIARQMRLPEEEVERIASAARIHDIGKVIITDFILKKPEKLSAEEYNEIKKHPEVGFNVAGRLHIYRKEAEIIRCHHERYDGAGYPLGLNGGRIPLGARILAVAEAYDSITVDKAYRKALEPAEAAEEIKKGRENRYDPQVVDAFLKTIKNMYSL